MVRNTAREIAVHLSYELSFTDKSVEELLDQRLTPETFADPLRWRTPSIRRRRVAKQADYIRRLVRGVAEHGPELDGYIAKYAKGWNFARIPLVASAIMRVAMYEILYMPEIPNGAAINEAVEIAKKYETPETVKFINGILGTFVRQEICGIRSDTRQSGSGGSRRPALRFLHTRDQGGTGHGAACFFRHRGEQPGQEPAGRGAASAGRRTSGGSCPTTRSIPPATTTSP